MGKNIVWVFLVLANLFWAGNFVFGKFMVTELPPLLITFSRWSLALILLIPIAYFYEKPKWASIKKEWFQLLLMGILGIIGYNLILLNALEYTTATNAALVSALNPGIIVLFSFILLREKLSLVQVLGIVISLIGVTVVLTEGNLAQIFLTDYNMGDQLMILVVLCWTFYSIIGRKLTTPPITATAVSTLISILIMLPMAMMQIEEITKISSMSFIGMLYMAIFPCVTSFLLWNISVRRVGVNISGVFLNLIPVFTAIIGLIMGERITSAQVIGGLLVFLGVYFTTGLLDRLLNRGGKKNQNKKTAIRKII